MCVQCHVLCVILEFFICNEHVHVTSVEDLRLLKYSVVLSKLMINTILIEAFQH